MVVRRPEFAIRRTVVQSQCHGRHLDSDVLVRACIARATKLSKQSSAIQSYRWITAIGACDRNVLIDRLSEMSSVPQPDNERSEIDRLVAELEKAEAYEVRLRQFFVDIKAELAAGHAANAMSMLNEALRFIDDATDVVAPHQEL
jgi:hypothetical protein